MNTLIRDTEHNKVFFGVQAGFLVLLYLVCVPLGFLAVLALGLGSLPIKAGGLVVIGALAYGIKVFVWNVDDWAQAVVSWWYAPSKKDIAKAEAAWAAEFDRAFTLEYPRWREFVATGKYRSSEFKAIKDILEGEWLQHRPANNDKLPQDALWTVIRFKNDGNLEKGSGMHILYRNWEVAQDTMRIRRNH